MKCEICGKSDDGFYFDVAVSVAFDTEDENHYLCVAHYKRWLRWHNWRRWLKKMRAEGAKDVTDSTA